MTANEEENRRFNSDGEELFLQENGVWLPQKAVMTDEEKEAYYARFSHPKINFFAVGLIILGVIGLCVGAFFLARVFLPTWASVLSAVAVLLVVIAVFRIKIAVFCIKLYQRFAPMSVRERCVFTPTCSDYAIAAITKYGVIKGVKLANDRLDRCHGEYRDDPLE